MLATDLHKMNPNEYDVRFWLRELAIQLADINGNLFALRQQAHELIIEEAPAK